MSVWGVPEESLRRIISGMKQPKPRTPDGRTVEQPDPGPEYVGEHPGERSPRAHPESTDGAEEAQHDQDT